MRADLMHGIHFAIVLAILSTAFALFKAAVLGFPATLPRALSTYGVGGMLAGFLLGAVRSHLDKRWVCVGIGALLGPVVIVFPGLLTVPLGTLTAVDWFIAVAVGAVVGAFVGDNYWYRIGMKKAGRFFRSPPS